ncbi:hypothetical protein JCM15060_19930 [Halanaerobaculum tunisiense]
MRIIGNEFEFDPKNIFGYVLGEHGSSSFVTWSIAGICGYNFETFARIRGVELELDREEILQRVHQLGFDIWEKKGYTNQI